MQAIRLTTNLSYNLFTFLAECSNKLNITKRKILEDSIKLYQKEMKRQEMLKGCNAMGEDEEESNEWLLIANNKANL